MCKIHKVDKIFVIFPECHSTVQQRAHNNVIEYSPDIINLFYIHRHIYIHAHLYEHTHINIYHIHILFI